MVDMSPEQVQLVQSAARRIARAFSFSYTAEEDNYGLCLLHILEALQRYPSKLELPHDDLARVCRLIARRAIFQWYRKRKTEGICRRNVDLVVVDDDELDYRLGSQEPKQVSTVECNELRRAINMLQPHQRSLVRWILDGLGYQEIGSMLGISRQAVEQQWLTAVNQLRNWLLKRRPPRGPNIRHSTAAELEAARNYRASATGKAAVDRYMIARRRMRKERRSGIFVIGAM